MLLRVTGLFFSLFVLATVSLGQDRGESWPIHTIDDSSRGADGVKLLDVNGDGLLDITTGFEEGGVTRVYLHPGKGKVRERWPSVQVGKTKSVEDAVFVDLDKDGAVDVLSCTEGRTKTLFVQWAPSKKEDYLKAASWKQEVIGDSKGKMAWMFAMPMQVDGKHGPDIIAAGKGGGAAIGWYEAPAKARNVGDYRWHELQKMGWVMSIILDDMDGDGDMDLVYSDRRGAGRGCYWLENPGANKAAEKWKRHLIGGKSVEVMFMKLADLDGDGLKDVMVSAKPAAVHVFKRKDKTGKAWEESKVAYPKNMGSAKAVAAGDMDGDKIVDLVISCEHANPPKSGVLFLKGDGKGNWQPREISGTKGIKFDRIELFDVDADGDLDVFTCEERHKLELFWYENPTVSQ